MTGTSIELFQKFNLSFLNLLSKKRNYLLKIFLLWYSHQFLCQNKKSLIFNDISFKSTSVMELYMLDNKVIRVVIEEIIETGEYTLEGIANYSRLPIDVFIDIMCENHISPSLTLWSKVISLYVQVKPEIVKYLFDTLTSENDVKNNLMT